MKSLFALAVGFTLGHGMAIPAELEPRQFNMGTTTGGSGPYAPANWTSDATLANHTLYLPLTIPSGLKLPVLVWGNGGCAAQGRFFERFLAQIASFGYFVIANGAPNGTGQTTAQWMTDAIDWAVANAGKGAYAAVDASRVAAAGQSCGGIEAYAQASDPRVATIGIFNSGLLTNYTSIADDKKPTFYFLGGSTDIAYVNGERDYKALPDGVPSWKGNIPVGHGGTYSQVDGGLFATAGVHWLDWLLKGNTTAAQYFTGPSAASAGFEVESKNLDKITTH